MITSLHHKPVIVYTSFFLVMSVEWIDVLIVVMQYLKRKNLINDDELHLDSDLTFLGTWDYIWYEELHDYERKVHKLDDFIAKLRENYLDNEEDTDGIRYYISKLRRSMETDEMIFDNGCPKNELVTIASKLLNFAAKM